MTPRSPLHFAVVCVLAAVSGPLLAGGKAPTCTVKVVDANGESLAGATVEAHAFELDSWRLGLEASLLAKGTTTLDGRFSFEAPANSLPYIVVVLAHKKGSGIDWANWRARGSGDFTLRLAGGVALAGTVVDEAGKSIAGAEVRPVLFTRSRRGFGVRVLLAPLGTNLLIKRTDAKGRFRFEDVPKSARADLRVLAKGKAKTFTYRRGMNGGQFAAGQTDIRITLADEAKVSGTVVDGKSGRPVAGVRVTARSKRGGMFSSLDEATTGADGAFTIGRLPAGQFAVITLRPKSGLGKWVPIAAELEVKVGQAIRGVKLEVIRGGVLEVKVTDAVTGAPVLGAYLTASPKGRPDRPGARGMSALSRGDGAVRMRLDPGKYTPLSVWKLGTHKPYSGKEAFEIVDGKTRKLVVKLQRLAAIRGVVRDAGGKPVQGAEISILPARLTGSLTGSLIQTDAKGRFEFPVKDLAGGSRRSSAAPRVIVRLPKRNLVGMVEIGENAKATLEIELAPGARIVGYVVDPTGKPIPGAMVYPLWEGGGTSPSLTTETDKKGRYELQALLPGDKYNVWVWADGYGRVKVEIGVAEELKGPVRAEKIVLKQANLSISGVVLDPDGKPVAGVTVRASGKGQPGGMATAIADKKGKFKIVKLCKGEVRLSARAKDRKTRGSTEANAGDTDVEIQLEQPGSNRPTRKTPPPTVPKGEDF